MSVQEVTYYRVVCDRPTCGRDSADQGFTAAFPNTYLAQTDWITHGGSVDPASERAFCNWHPDMDAR